MAEVGIKVFHGGRRAPLPAIASLGVGGDQQHFLFAKKPLWRWHGGGCQGGSKSVLQRPCHKCCCNCGSGSSRRCIPCSQIFCPCGSCHLRQLPQLASWVGQPSPGLAKVSGHLLNKRIYAKYKEMDAKHESITAYIKLLGL